ncbi:MAG: HD domain-containing protein [Candidatus Marinimicrobia bacterium]|nr:HD domain-containing protein [Candidatus Neomarinimicrobiota bacterium]MCF7850098.1 HD domain-containing protein [Candidatus Neomarinimicrobiota bacterium]
MTAKITQIKNFKKNTNIQGFFLVREKHLRSTRNNHPYLQLELQDNTGDIEAKVWEDVPAFEKIFEAGDAVVVKGRVSEYAERLQLEVQDIGQASPEKHADYGFDLSQLIPATRRNIDQMWKSLGKIIQGMKNEHLKKLVTNIYKEHAELIKTHPASMRLHHAWLGGYLEHILSMSLTGRTLGKHYRLDVDLLLTGILLHDIGKLIELNPAQKPGYTDRGRLIGHIVMGRDMVRDEIQEIVDFPADLQMKVEHMILAHQGKYEWQSPKQPKFPEALLLHHIDELDARMNMMSEVIERDQEAGIWTNRFNYFRRSILKGELEDDENSLI